MKSFHLKDLGRFQNPADPETGFRTGGPASVFSLGCKGVVSKSDSLKQSRALKKIRTAGEDDDDEDKEESKESGPDPLLSKMLKTRTILLSGEIKKDLAERTIRQLLLLEDMGEDPIRVFIDSPGGDADAGYAIFDMIRFVKPPVWTIGMGLVASAAAIIQLASPKERRVGLPNSHYLIHQPLSGIRGVATDIEIHARELDKLRAKINHLIANETGAPFDRVERDTDRDYWMNADEAVTYGLISRIISTRGEL
jgi:ATP-dependent Clp protease protease subunit